MCDLATGLTIASAVFGYAKQSETAARQENAIRASAEQQKADLAAQANEQRVVLTDQASQAAREERVATAQLMTLAGESGLSGGSQDRVVNQAKVNFASDIATIEANRQRSVAQAGRAMNAADTNAATKISSIQRPSIIGTGLQIAGAYNDYQTGQVNKKVPTAKA